MEQAHRDAVAHHGALNGFNGVENPFLSVSIRHLIQGLGFIRLAISVQSGHRPDPKMIGKRAERLLQCTKGCFGCEPLRVEPDVGVGFRSVLTRMARRSPITTRTKRSS